MKRRVISLLLALCMALLPAMGTMAEELELFISADELVIDKDNQTDGEETLDHVNQDNASILEQLGKKDWTSLAASVQKNGDWREDIVAVAQTQVGYAESEDGMTIYTTWADCKEPQAWTTLFVNWVAAQAGLTEEDFPRLDTYKAFTERMNKIHALKNIARSAYPMSGDLAVIEKDNQQLIGIVVYVSNGVASVITGDDNGAVVTDTYMVGQYGFKQYIDLDVLMERAGIEVGKGGKVPVIPEGGVAAWTNTNAVYMRSEPTTASKRVTTVKKTGTALLVVSAEMQADGYIWYGVEYGKYEGFIRGDLLDLDMAAIPAATPVPTAKPAPTATPVPTAVPGCALCVSVADGVALPMDCCYEHLAALGSEYANQFMAALMEADPLTRQLYVNCHDAHVAAGAEAIIPLGGLGLVERVVNIEVKKALVGEAVTIGFDIYGANKYQWYKVEQVEAIIDGETVTSEVVTKLEDETAAELTVYAKPGADIGYYCVATLPLRGAEVDMTSKRTMISANNAPIVAEAILGEEVNFAYEYVGAESYRWFKLDLDAVVEEVVQPERVLAADGAKFTTYATEENEGAYYYCEALNATGEVMSTSSYFMYTIDMEDMCKYVDELVNMTRTERYNIMIGLWNEAGLAQRVTDHWKNGCDGKHFNDYFRLLCCCSETLQNPFGVQHETYCGWYIAPESTEQEIVISIDVTYGMKHYEECEITNGIWYDLYLDDVLVQSGSNDLLCFVGADYERTYRCDVTMADGSVKSVTYVVTADETASLQQYLNDISSSLAKFDEVTSQYVYDKLAVYELMTKKWFGKFITVRDIFTQETTEVNLVQGVFKEWKQYPLDTEKGMFCTCCYDGTKLNDKIMLHPDALHQVGCPWYQPPKNVSAANGIVVSGTLPEGVTLNASEKTPDPGVLTLMQDANETSIRVSLKAYDITPANADGTVWQPAKGATVQVTIPNAYMLGSNTVVNVYHLLVDESEIAPGYGYEKLSSAHFGGVILNDDGGITFETDGFSTFYVEVTSATDMCYLCDGQRCKYSIIISALDAQDRFAELERQNGSLATFLDYYYRHVEAGAFDLLCSSMARGMTKEQLTAFDPSGAHDTNCMDENCPWRVQVTYHTGVDLLVGDEVTLICDQADVSSTWYRQGSESVIATGASVTVNATAQMVTYQCKNGDTVLSTHVVVAQTSVPYYYISRISNTCFSWSTNTYNRDAVYELMTGKWNVVANAYQKAEPANLAQSIVAYWYETALMSVIDDMFCSCCFTTDGNGTYTFDGIMLHPDAYHKGTCAWKHDAQAGMTPLMRADGTIEGYVLALPDANGKVQYVATTDMLDGKYHYFKDVATGLYIAYLYVDEDETQWIVPLKSERVSAD